MLAEGLQRICDEIEAIRDSFLEANPDAAKKDKALYSFYLDELSLYLKLKWVSDDKRIDDGDLSDVERCFPEGLTPQETEWLKAALESDFAGRNVLLDELSHARVLREVGEITRSLFFVYDYPREDLGRGFQQAAIMRAYQEDAPSVQAQVFVALGRPVITQLFIAQVGGGGLDLEGASLDDRPFNAYSFSVEAVEAVQRLYHEGAYTSASGQLDFSGAIAMAEGRRAAQTARIEDLMRAAIPEAALSIEADPLPLATRFDVSLGSDGGWDYVAEVCCSLVSGFYHAQVRRFNEAEPLGEGSHPQQQYPNGWMLQRIRDALFADGYKPLSNLRRRTHAWFGNRLVDTTFGDCLFTARIGYGRK